MDVTIARRPFYILPSDVEDAMRGVTPEPITGASVTIGRSVFPVMQVGAAITHQDRRDFSSAEMLRALRALGFTCHAASSSQPLI